MFQIIFPFITLTVNNCQRGFLRALWQSKIPHISTRHIKVTDFTSKLIFRFTVLGFDKEIPRWLELDRSKYAMFYPRNMATSRILAFFFTDIRLDWEAYNILPQDTQLLDMLVFIGQPLPVFKDGQEVVPAVQEQDLYRCEEPPFIQVKLREHDGVCADRPFDVIPKQQVGSWSRAQKGSVTQCGLVFFLRICFIGIPMVLEGSLPSSRTFFIRQTSLKLGLNEAAQHPFNFLWNQCW